MAQSIYTNAGPADNFTNFQSDDLDSGYLMRDAFNGGLNNDIAVSDIMLAWILRIPTGIDPAEAAKHILGCYAKRNTHIKTPKVMELVKILQELTQFDSNRMKQIARSKRNRKTRRNNNLIQNCTLN